MQINIDIFGKYEEGTYYPHHYIIHGGYNLKDWLGGDFGKEWRQSPLFKSYCIYPADRILALKARNIVSLPPMLDSKYAYWFGPALQEVLMVH